MKKTTEEIAWEVVKGEDYMSPQAMLREIEKGRDMAEVFLERTEGIVESLTKYYIAEADKQHGR